MVADDQGRKRQGRLDTVRVRLDSTELRDRLRFCFNQFQKGPAWIGPFFVRDLTSLDQDEGELLSAVRPITSANC
jgi:hypothetical protein